MRAYLGLLESDAEHAPEIAVPGYARLAVEADRVGIAYELRGEPTTVNGAPAETFSATWPGIDDVRGKAPALFTAPRGGELLYVWAAVYEATDALV